jgi:beta-glucanase (GH16 family)
MAIRSTMRLRALFALLLLAVPAAAQWWRWPDWGNMQWIWGDEFDGWGGINGWKWVNGGGWSGGWGNNELQSYQQGNVWKEDGKLVLFAEKKWSPDGAPYRSGKIASDTKHGYNIKWGLVEVRAKVPRGKGLWPAIWMMPGAYLGWGEWLGKYGDWPASGELDIMEAVNDMNSVHHSLHYGGQGWWNKESQSCWVSPGWSYAWEYHTYIVEWAPWNIIKFFVDGVLTCSFNGWWSSGGGWPAPFDQPFHLIMNLAVGGNWPGWPDDSVLPAKMYVDYVRVFQYKWMANWPRRLDEEGNEYLEVPEDLEEIPEEWGVPEGFDIRSMSWKEGYGPYAERQTMAEGEAQADQQCIPTPYHMDRPYLLNLEFGTVIEAEHYDFGGEGCAYHDLTPVEDKTPGGRGNSMFRYDDGVDFIEFPGSTHGPYVTHMQKKEWLSYTVEAVAGKDNAGQTYELATVMSSGKTGGSFEIILDTTDCAGRSADAVIFEETTVPAGKEEKWMTFSRVVMLPSDVHTITVCVKSGMLNFDFMTFKAWEGSTLSLQQGDQGPGLTGRVDTGHQAEYKPACSGKSCEMNDQEQRPEGWGKKRGDDGSG